MKGFSFAGINRRAFLAGVTGAAGGAWAAGRAARADDKPWTMRLSGSTINFTRLPVEQAFARLAAVGFEAVDVWSANAGCPHLDDVLNRLGPEGLKQLLETNKLKLYSFSVYAGGFPKYAELLGKAGGGVAIRGSSGPCKPEELTARMKAFLEALKPEADLAEKNNSYLAIENHGHSLLDSVDSFKAFVDLNQNPRIGIAMAPYHVQAHNESVEAAIAACGKQLLYFYAWQHASGVDQLPGHGPADFTPWLAALAKVSYGGYVNPFLHGEPDPDTTSAALKKSVEYLRGCSAKVGG
jgi:sugar phosphate isomerase/epimerase